MSFDESEKYSAQEEVFYNDGRELDLLRKVFNLPEDKLRKIRGNPDGVLEAIDQFAREEKYLMNIGSMKAKLVRDVIRKHKPRVMVELGGYVAYSAIAFASEMKKVAEKGASLRYYTLELDPVFGAIMMALIDLAGLSDIVKVIIGPSDRSIRDLKTLEGVSKIDILFLDHHKPLYVRDLRTCESLGLINTGSVLVADNVVKPGNPPYLEWVRMSCEEKRERLAQQKTNGNRVNDTHSQDDEQQQHGRWDLVYDSSFIESYEMTGVPDAIEVTNCTGVSSQ